MKTLIVLFCLLASSAAYGQVLPTFDPQGKPGEAARMGIEAENAQQASMTQAQNRTIAAQQAQIAQQQADRERQIFEMERQVREAKAKAEVREASGDVSKRFDPETAGEPAADNEKAHPGNDVYLPRKIEWLALEAQSMIPPTFRQTPGFMLDVMCFDSETISIHVIHNAAADKKVMRAAIGYAKECVNITAKSHHWDSWVKVVEDIKQNDGMNASVKGTRGNEKPEDDERVPLMETPKTPGRSIAVPGSKAITMGSGHWVKANISDGDFVQLEDGSLWQIDPLDKVDASLWLPASEITLVESTDGSPGFEYLLVNTDDSEKAHAKPVSRK